MPPPHLLLHAADYILSTKAVGFFAQDDLKRQVEQEIAQFAADRRLIALSQCVIQLQGLFHQIGPQTLGRLRPVPGAPFSEVADQQDSASKR